MGGGIPEGRSGRDENERGQDGKRKSEEKEPGNSKEEVVKEAALVQLQVVDGNVAVLLVCVGGVRVSVVVDVRERNPGVGDGGAVEAVAPFGVEDDDSEESYDGGELEGERGGDAEEGGHI